MGWEVLQRTMPTDSRGIKEMSMIPGSTFGSFLEEEIETSANE
jgi:hypothetical protein